MMGVSESVTDLSQNPAYFDRRYRPVLLQTLAKVVALDVRHHEVDEIVLLFDGVDRDDVRMIQLRGCLGFAEEPLPDVRPKAQLGRQDLDRDLPLETFVARAIHDAHAATTDFGL